MRAEGRAVDTVQAANTTRAPPDTAAPARREEEEAGKFLSKVDDVT